MQPDNSPNPEQHQHKKIAGVAPIVLRMLDADEQVIAVIHKHIIGLLLIYLVAVGAIGGILAVSVFAFPALFGSFSGSDSLILTAIAILTTGLFFFVLAVITYIYNQNEIVLTNKNIMQVLQNGLFSRKVSRLNLSDVQDVTADQSGILPSLFNYGILNIETAGEQKNFVFSYTPDPNRYADLILDQRQKYADDTAHH